MNNPWWCWAHHDIRHLALANRDGLFGWLVAHGVGCRRWGQTQTKAHRHKPWRINQINRITNHGNSLQSLLRYSRSFFRSLFSPTVSFSITQNDELFLDWLKEMTKTAVPCLHPLLVLGLLCACSYCETEKGDREVMNKKLFFFLNSC